MDEIRNILGQPKHIEGVGYVYPVKLSDYGDFMEVARLITVTKERFPPELRDEYSLFELVTSLSLHADESVSLLKLVKMVTDKEFKVIDGESVSLNAEDGSSIDNSNFEEFRKVVMDQNLLYEEKVFKNPMVKKWADKVLETRQRDAIDMSMEDIISVVHVGTGVPYDTILNYTIYQLRHTFQRVVKIKDWERSIKLLCAGAEGIKEEPYTEKIEMAKNPYDDVFKSKDKDKLSKVTSK